MKKTIARSIMCLTLALTLLVGLSAPASAKVGSIYRINAQGVHLRTAPKGGVGNEGNIIASLSKGSKVVHLSTKNGWWRVRTASGKVGYVYRSFMTVTSGSNSTTTVKAGATCHAKTTVNVRASATTASKKLGKIKKGTAVYVIATNGTWAKIRVKNGNTGYVAVKYIG